MARRRHQKTGSLSRKGDPRPAAEIHSGLPREVTRIIQQCLRKDPAWRYQSAADLKISLCDLQREMESGAPETAAPPAPQRHRARLWVAALALGLALGDDRIVRRLDVPPGDITGMLSRTRGTTWPPSRLVPWNAGVMEH
jgi:hypothetical protein